MMASKMEASWKAVLAKEFEQAYFQKISQTLQKWEQEGKTIYPSQSLIFNVFHTTPFEQVKVVILGQDPYHNPGQAMGLSFSVPRGERIPPSLRNIYKELADDVGFVIPRHGDLSAWADRGVFLLNTVLSVEKNQPSSHKNIGWQDFTDAAIRALSTQREHLVFMLWGAFAAQKSVLIDSKKHLILNSSHPSPLSAYRGFLGNKHFSQANAYLTIHGKEAIDWHLDL